VIVSKATEADFEEMVNNLSDLHTAEIAAVAEHVGFTPEVILGVILSSIEFQPTTTAKRDGKVIAMWSHAPLTDETNAIWFLATKAFFDNTVANFRFCRRQIGDEQAVIQKNLTVVSWSKHPKAAQWGRLIGFDTIQQEGSALRFTRTWKTG
jgi:hypothetical protein